MQHTYPGCAVDVAEIDPAVTEANFQATGLPRDTPIRTTFGDARQFVERNQGTKHYDMVFGDAFNDFSVPWHLTTREFNEKIARMLGDRGVYMINIIDAYESDATAEEHAERQIKKLKDPDDAAKARVRRESLARGRRYGGFLGAWVKTAKLTFPHVYIFGTDEPPGSGLRETFVVVASKQRARRDPRRARGPRRRPQVLPGRPPLRAPPVRPQGPRSGRPPLAGDRPDRRLRRPSRTCSPPSPRRGGRTEA